MNTQELILKYVPLANKLAYDKKRTLPKHVDVEELQSAAYLGLTEAANRYEESRGISFSTFAYPRISGAILDYLRQQSWGKRGEPVFPVNIDSLNPEAHPELQDKSTEMFDLISKDFEDKAKEMMKCYFIDEISMKEVGKRFGVSESRISQLITEYKSRIKTKWTKEDLQVELAA